MLSDRERWLVEGEIVDAASGMLATLGPPIEHDAMVDVMDRVDALAQRAAGDLDPLFCERIEEIRKCTRAVRRARSPRGQWPALYDAIQDSLAHRQGNPPVARWSATYLGGGVRRVRTEPVNRYTLDVDVATLTDRFGFELVASLLRLCAGASRVISHFHLLGLNDTLDRASVAHERNFQFLVMQLIGYLREFGIVVDDLAKAEIEQKLTDRTPWERLMRERARWDELVGSIRNDITFHLGWPSRTIPALSRQAARRARTIIYEWDGEVRINSRYTGGETLLLQSCGLETKEFRRVVGYSAEAWAVLLTSLEAIIDDLLTQCGARLR